MFGVPLVQTGAEICFAMTDRAVRRDLRPGLSILSGVPGAYPPTSCVSSPSKCPNPAVNRDHHFALQMSVTTDVMHRMTGSAVIYQDLGRMVDSMQRGITGPYMLYNPAYLLVCTVRVAIVVHTMGHEESCNTLLHHVFHLPLHPAALLQASQNVLLRQQMHILQAKISMSVESKWAQYQIIQRRRAIWAQSGHLCNSFAELAIICQLLFTLLTSPGRKNWSVFASGPFAQQFLT